MKDICSKLIEECCIILNIAVYHNMPYRSDQLCYFFFRSLHKAKNYIHIHLCINLAITLIILVAGIDKTGDLDEDVPIHCQIIAVLLHYFFLASFMWMLMEGVNLLMSFVRITVMKKLSYILTLTFISYGVPLLYLALLALPLGFGLDNEEDYYGSNVA